MPPSDAPDANKRRSLGSAASRTGRGWQLAAALVIVAAFGISPTPKPIDRVILGQPPGYRPASVSLVPNLAAIDRMIWVPGLDGGWDPQGLAFAGGSLFVSAYRSSGAWTARGPCRVFRVDPRSGEETGHVDIPPPCGHAGGLAYAGGKLFVADTRTLFEIDLGRAFDGSAPKFATFPLGPGLKGAFAISGDNALWIGDYQESRPAKVWEFPLFVLAALPDGSALRAEMAAKTVPIPAYGQGGAIDAAGELWLARSDLGWGFIDKIRPGSGHPGQRYPAPPGIEGLAFDDASRLWAVAEAGARHLPLHYPFFPLIFRFDRARLIPSD
jgi:hypothetical protein